jgi:hypothetical protein
MAAAAEAVQQTTSESDRVSTAAETAPAPQSPSERVPSDQWERFKTLVTDASKPIGVMLQALDVREVGVEQGILKIVLGPKAKLFQTMLEQKQDEVLVPAARSAYGVDRIKLVEQGSQDQAPQSDSPESVADDKLELLKKTFDATESLFGS